jgi:hypothetical protein
MTFDFRSKSVTQKNKNKILPKFLSPSITSTYGVPAQKNAKIFGSNLHTRLIIEGVFFTPVVYPEFIQACPRELLP